MSGEVKEALTWIFGGLLFLLGPTLLGIWFKFRMTERKEQKEAMASERKEVRELIAGINAQMSKNADATTQNTLALAQLSGKFDLVWALVKDLPQLQEDFHEMFAKVRNIGVDKESRR